MLYGGEQAGVGRGLRADLLHRGRRERGHRRSEQGGWRGAGPGVSECAQLRPDRCGRNEESRERLALAKSAVWQLPTGRRIARASASPDRVVAASRGHTRSTPDQGCGAHINPSARSGIVIPPQLRPDVRIGEI
jgi:hypothetical protein